MTTSAGMPWVSFGRLYSHVLFYFTTHWTYWHGSTTRAQLESVLGQEARTEGSGIVVRGTLKGLCLPQHGSSHRTTPGL